MTKLTKRTTLSLILAGALLFACGEEKTEIDGSLEQAARAVIEELSQEQYQQVVARFDLTMMANVTEADLEDIWSSLTTQCGVFVKQGVTKRSSVDEFEIVFVELQFANLPYWGKIIFDDQLKIAGLRFVAELPLEEPTMADYINPDSFIERGGQFGGQLWPLPGVVTVPVGTGPFPAVILVHRHGPNDRNEAIGSNYPFLDLALGLASKGVAVLRYDNRSFTHRSKFDTLQEVTVQDEIIRDIHFAVSLLKSSPEIDPSQIYMLGHGFGGYLAPMVAEQTDSIAGYILLGAPTRPLEQVIADEVEYFLSEDGSISGSEQYTLDKLRSEAEMVNNPELTNSMPAEFLPLGLPGSYWLDLRKYDPIESALKMTEPMLILQGERDFHATMADYEAWRELLLVRNNIQLRSFPKLNHLFMSGEGRSNPEEYLIRGNVDGELIDHIAKWIKSPK